jgi:tripartite ATP-independent transporter DctM subunit
MAQHLPGDASHHLGDLARLGAEFLASLWAAALPLLTPGIIVGGIIGGFFTPTEASVVAVLYSMLLGLFVLRSIGWRAIPQVLYDSARFAAISLFCIGTASAFGWLLAYFHIPQLFVNLVKSYGGGVISVGFITAIAFLIIGCFIDAIPAIIIVGTILEPLAKSVGMSPLHFAIVGVISIAFGLVTPPYGLCLMIACALGETTIARAFKDTAVLLVPMLLVLCFVILFPDVILALPRQIMPKYVQ